MNVTLHRYAPIPEPGDLTLADLRILWGLLLDENLVETFFHDGSVSSLPEFVRYATDPAVWFYGVRLDGRFIGFGVVNNFTSTGNTAFVHLCSFAEGRKAGDSANSPFADAGRQWFRLLAKGNGQSRDSGPRRPAGGSLEGAVPVRRSLTGIESRDGASEAPPREARLRNGGLDTAIAVFPACYRGLRQWVRLFGFEERMRLPGALRLVRKQGVRMSDALVYSKSL